MSSTSTTEGATPIFIWTRSNSPITLSLWLGQPVQRDDVPALSVVSGARHVETSTEVTASTGDVLPVIVVRLVQLDACTDLALPVHRVEE